MVNSAKVNLAILILVATLFPINLSNLEGSKDWIEISSSRGVSVSIKKDNGSTFCKATRIYSHPSDKIKRVLDDKENYPTIFKRIDSVETISDDIVHIKLDLPFPFYGRDYVVKYRYKRDGDTEYYIFEATEEVEVPEESEYVRLINASGVWKIEPMGVSRSKLTHYWNGELRGNFPDWALRSAWKAQGRELLSWIEDALN